jgi:predicted nucleic acid-binding protein
MTSYLLDTNIILRFCDGNSQAQSETEQAIIQLWKNEDIVYITAQNLIEFWSVASRPSDVNGLGWTTHKIHSELVQLQHLFPLLADTADVFTHWLQLVSTFDIKGKKVHDARLVAVMSVYEIPRLLTYNVTDFKSFSHISAIRPQDIEV